MAKAHKDATRYDLIALENFPLVRPGDDISQLIIDAMAHQGIGLASQDIVVIAQKIVSKAEGRYADLSAIAPSERAKALAQLTGKPASIVEAILQQSNSVLRTKSGVMVCEQLSGHVMANAGIDHSNTGAPGEQTVLLLPEDADASAEAIRKRLSAHFGAQIGIIISDSIGRAWRLGTIGHAIGAAGIPSLIDRRGEPDLDGRSLRVTMTGFADAVAAAAVILMGEGDEGRPVILVRGLKWTAAEQLAKALIRPVADDMFR